MTMLPTTDTLKQVAMESLAYAKQYGASSAEVEVNTNIGKNISVRMGALENIEHTHDKGMMITVYFGNKMGHASSSDLTHNAIKDTVLHACDIARYTASDPCFGLADAALLSTQEQDLNLFHAWQIETDEAVKLILRCEEHALAVDARIRNSEGAQISQEQHNFIYANSHGFCSGYPSSQYSISCCVIAEEQGNMQRDYWYSVARDAHDLHAIADIGRLAGARALRRLNPRPIKTCKVPVLFDAPLADGLIGIIMSAISGGNLYRKSSFLLDCLGERIATPLLTIYEEPHLEKGLASAFFDDEGVTTQARTLIEKGVLQSYLLDSYSSRRLGMTTTGHAGGHHNLIIPSTHTQAELLKLMHTGLVVTELLGQGVNKVTGDYSRGAAGFWVENGVIQHAVEEITIAGNLRTMLLDIIAIGDDILRQSARQVGSILIKEMMVAGN